MSDSAPPRLMVFFHGEGSTPEEFAPVALSWQLKFPGATVLVMQGLRERTPGRWEWFDARGVGEERVARLQDAAKNIAIQIRESQRQHGFSAPTTILVGYSQGASLLLEIVRSHPELCGFAIAYSGRLLRPIRASESITTPIHLIHGGLDSLVPLVYARQAFDGLKAIGADVTLDVMEDSSHHIDQDQIILGTTRAMQSVFKHRKKMRLKHLN
jgi:phospholipase/carboxylesterase